MNADPIQPGVNAPPPRRRRWPVVVAIAGWVLGGTAVGLSLGLRPAGPPGAPQDLRATAAMCLPPDCPVWTVQVKLSWRAPTEGGAVTSYDVLRDGVHRADVTGTELTFLDDDAALSAGEAPEYAVVAKGADGSSPTSPAIKAKIPVPGKPLARLSGRYRVRLKITSASFFSSVLGVDDPAIGDTKSDTWDITPVCSHLVGACDVQWEGYSPALTRDGASYSGSVETPGHCGGKDARSTYRLKLHITRVHMNDQVLSATGFHGTVEVTLVCPDATSRATATVVATL